MSDNQNDSNEMRKKPSTVIQILIGLGISLLAYALTILPGYVVNNYPIAAIFDLVILVVFGFLIVRFFRTGYTAAAVTMLILITPALFILLLFGACAIVSIPL